MTQVHPGDLSAAVPPEVAQLAAAQQLGTFRTTFAPNKRWRLIWSAAVLAFIFGLMTVIIAVQSVNSIVDPTDPGTAYGIMAVVLVVLLGLFLWPLVTSPVVSAKARARAFFVYEQGYVHVGRKGPEAYRWDAVAAVYQEIVNTRYNGISTGTNYRYQLKFGDGRTVKLTTFSTDMARFGPLLQTEIANTQLPRFWQALGAGQNLGFGLFILSSSGIATTSKATVPWSEITGVQVTQGRVSVRQAGKRLAFAATGAKEIPNLYTFLTLVERLSGTA